MGESPKKPKLVKKQLVRKAVEEEAVTKEEVLHDELPQEDVFNEETPEIVKCCSNCSGFLTCPIVHRVQGKQVRDQLSHLLEVEECRKVILSAMTEKQMVRLRACLENKKRRFSSKASIDVVMEVTRSEVEDIKKLWADDIRTSMKEYLTRSIQFPVTAPVDLDPDEFSCSKWELQEEEPTEEFDETSTL